ncbi:hypothetical protein AB4342_01370 [Vibrio breoganii]
MNNRDLLTTQATLPTEPQEQAIQSQTSTSASIDTSSTFWGDVLEVGTDMFGGSGASVPSAGSAPSGSAPQPFRASSGNIAQVLKMFSPYK